MTLILNPQYYDRTDPAKNYDEHMFVAGRGLQSAELNEIQKTARNLVKDIGNALFKDGDVVRDAVVVVNQLTGAVTCASGAIYLRGAVRGVQPATLTVATVGTHAIGVRLIESRITAVEDPELLDPATGTRNYNQPGAERLKVDPTWAVGEAGDTDFFPVYTVTDGVLDAKEAPPQLDSVTQALARYDRDSAGGNYVVSGLELQALADVGAIQNYSLSEGRCRVYGYPFDFATSRRVTLAAVPDLRVITNEPHLSTSESAQRIDFDFSPATNITELQITAVKTVTLTHGVVTGALDPLPDTSVLQIIEVKQGATTYTANTDYKLTASKVDWSPAGAEPSPGSTYTCKYQYITLATPTAVDDTGFTVTGAVSGTLVQVSYSQKLPRIDRLAINSAGNPIWILGVAAAYNAQPPNVPVDMLPLASVYQTWTTSRRVVNDGVRVVPMPALAAYEDRLDYLLQLVAQNKLESSIHSRELGAKKGLFTDPFIDDSQRDAGTPQTGAIVLGELMLPISASISGMSSDISTAQTLGYTHTMALEQKLKTGSMKINPYMAFDVVPAGMLIKPAVDRWTEVIDEWASPQTSRFIVGRGDRSSQQSSSKVALLSFASAQIERLRVIPIAYTINGFGAGEIMTSLTFDGVVVASNVTANSLGVVSGTFNVPANLPSGNKAVVATGAGGSTASATFSGQGTRERYVWQNQTTVTETRWQSPPPPPPPPPPRKDPLAQTFTLTESIQLASVELWFSAKPTTRTRVQIRTTATGLPTQSVVAEAFLLPAAINIGGAVTRFAFASPVMLLANVEYAIVVICDDATGALSVAELGKFDASVQRWITSQPYTVGVLLSSSNASTWTPHQDRDLAFRLLRASFTQTTRSISLGSTAVTGVTDLLLMSYSERPVSDTLVDYVLGLPDGRSLTVADGQPVQLAAPITGDVSVTARLSGTADFSPTLSPDTQLVAGTIASSATYVSRAIPGGTSVKVKAIFEAFVPSGSTILLEYKGPDVGDTWVTVPQIAAVSADDGFVEFTHEKTGVNELSVQVRITLNGSAAARPAVRDLRVFVS